MALTSQDLYFLVSQKHPRVVFERKDPREDYTIKDEEETPLELERGSIYEVESIELWIRGIVTPSKMPSTIEALIANSTLTVFTEASRVIINGFKYSPFCFRIAEE